MVYMSVGWTLSMGLWLAAEVDVGARMYGLRRTDKEDTVVQAEQKEVVRGPELAVDCLRCDTVEDFGLPGNALHVSLAVVAAEHDVVVKLKVKKREILISRSVLPGCTSNERIPYDGVLRCCCWQWVDPFLAERSLPPL